MICCYYRYPYRSTNTLPQLSNSIALAARSASTINSKILVMGDFNVNLLDSSHYLFNELSDLISNFGLHQSVLQPTFHSPGINPSLLDHVYSNDPHLITTANCLAPLGACHHSVVHCYMNIRIPKPVAVSRSIWLYSKADWHVANTLLAEYRVNERDNINSAWDSFHSYLMQVMKQCVPQKNVRCKAKDPPWLNEDLRRLCRKSPHV